MATRRKVTAWESIEFHARTLREVESEYKDWRSAYRDKYRVTKKHKPKRLNGSRSPHSGHQRILHKYCMLVEFEKLRKKRTPRA
jgi:hypothetical protein